jgi:hypothetical protein
MVYMYLLLWLEARKDKRTNHIVPYEYLFRILEKANLGF